MPGPLTGQGEDPASAKAAPKEASAGKTLKKIFRQDDLIHRVEEQTASVSMLMNPTRLSIFLHLCRCPCEHTRSIARGLGRSLSTINWGLKQLHMGKRLDSRMLWSRRVYWPAGMVEEEDLKIVATLGAKWAGPILRFLAANGPARQMEVIESLGASQQNVNNWIGRMASVGMLERADVPGPVRYSLAPSFLERVRYYDAMAREYSKVLVAILREDGLMPKNRRLRGSRMSVDVMLPTGRRRLHIECSPMAPARAFVMRKM